MMLAGPLTIWKTGRKKIFLAFSSLIAIFVILQFFTLDDYRAIGSEEIIQSTLGSEEVYQWDDVETVDLTAETGKMEIPFPLNNFTTTKIHLMIRLK
ncbi:hypothetical protein [Gracilibacillus salinarum]|uniref:Uncharacterized protein n=1 Tax=Gracilibacillus salinarum TaxID=2932255 RepID=A0ABY4GI48_9BACI|nr:hypothetical protein [Gracilibacillus salinarum]UOQ84025.1 hypothetical protein MUN87_14955 [Gracilibacillus salinarum]